MSPAGDEQTRALRRLLGTHACVVVRGPAGIGKTSRLRQAVAGRGALVGQCLPSLGRVPYAPLADALAGWLRGAPAEVAVEVARRVGERLLVVEDVQWADPATLEVLARLLGRVRLAVTTREPLAIESDPRVATVEVHPLTPRAAHALARRLHPQLTADARAALVDAAAGNPLLLTALATDADVSPTLAAAMRARLQGLDPEQRDGLARLALAGAAAPGAVVGRLGRDAMAGLLGDGEGGTVEFRHRLIADAVLELTPRDDHPRLHREVAALLGGAAAAFHLEAAGDLKAAAATAERAAPTTSPTERASLLSLAVRCRGDGAPTSLRLDAASALLQAHRPADADAIATAVITAAESGAPVAAEHLVDAHLTRSRAAWMLGDAATAAAHLAGAIDASASADEHVRARVEIERAAQLVRTEAGDPRVIEVAARAVELADRTGIERARARSTLGLAHAHTGTPGWRELFAAAGAIAREDGDVEEELAASHWMINALAMHGSLEDAIAIGDDVVRRAEELGAVRWHHHILTAHAMHRLGSGRGGPHLLPELRRLIRQDPLFRNRAQVDLALATGLVDAGREDEAREVIRAGRVAARNDEDRSLLCVANADLAWATGDRALMRRAIHEVLTCGRGYFGITALLESAAIHLALADASLAERVPRIPTTMMPIIDAVGIEHDALDAWRAGDVRDATSLMSRAAERWEERALVRFAARAHLGAGEICRLSGEGRAEPHHERAAELADRWSLDPVRRTLRAIEQAARAQSAVSALTGREREVLALVAEGLRSSDIAGRLGVGVATVDSHVKSARIKLGAATRTQAAAMVRPCAGGRG